MKRRAQRAEDTTKPKAKFSLGVELFNTFKRKDIVNRVMSMSMTQSKEVNHTDWELFQQIIQRTYPGIVPKIKIAQFRKMKVDQWNKVREAYRKERIRREI